MRRFRVTTDITYVPTREGWLYLCVYIDLFSRRVVGWAMSERMTAVRQRRPGPSLLVHSDHGSQYASEFSQRQLQARHFVCSMSRKGNSWANSVAESFFHTLKGELIHHADYQTPLLFERRHEHQQD